MTQPKQELEGISIVLLGAFNPSIFQPAWFALQGLIRAEEAQAAKIEVMHSEIVSVSIEPMKLLVELGRFYISTTDPSAYEVLKDLTISVFHILRHTPVTAMGLNLDAHFRMSSEEAWHAVGHRLAPKKAWSSILEKPGMRSLTMEGVRPDSYKGYIRVRVEPSARVQPGVYFNVNDHYEFKDHKPEQGCDVVTEILRSGWRASFDRSKKIVESLITGLQ